MCRVAKGVKTSWNESDFMEWSSYMHTAKQWRGKSGLSLYAHWGLTVLKYSFKRWIKLCTGLTRFNSCYSFSYTFNSAASFMSKNNRKLSLRVIAAKSVTVCVTDTSSDNLDAYLTSFGWCHFNCFYCKWFTSLPGNCRTAGYWLQLTRAKGRIDVNNRWWSLQILDLQRLASLDFGLKETNSMVARSMQHNITQICQSP